MSAHWWALHMVYVASHLNSRGCMTSRVSQGKSFSHNFTPRKLFFGFWLMAESEEGCRATTTIAYYASCGSYLLLPIDASTAHCYVCAQSSIYVTTAVFYCFRIIVSVTPIVSKRFVW